jgi:Tol biopolymer transport system component
MAPVVSPDGERLAYVVITPSESWQVHVRRLDGTGPDIATGHQFLGGAASLGWSPDGELLVVSHRYRRGERGAATGGLRSRGASVTRLDRTSGWSRRAGIRAISSTWA